MTKPRSTRPDLAMPPRVVLAGQVPPPFGGQNVMIARLLEQLRAAEPEWRVEHLAFEFTKDFQTVRRVGGGKLWELGKVIGRLLRLRAAGPIDLLIHPTGGPQTVPLVRDLVLLPWMLLLCRRVVLHFHAAGLAERKDMLSRLVGRLYRCCAAAVVMTEFNRRDPLAAGLTAIHVAPHQWPDEYEAALMDRGGEEIRLLALGHLCPHKGTPALLEAFAALAREHSALRLELAGECLPPWNDDLLRAEIDRLGIRDRVRLLGVLRGGEKQRAWGRAHLFVFPSVAPYESFGLVMVEAMMWALPLVVSDWRGNRDVVGANFGGICYAPGADHAASLQKALRAALAQRTEWREWGVQNRQRFERAYDFQLGKDSAFVQMVRQLLLVQASPPPGKSD